MRIPFSCLVGALILSGFAGAWAFVGVEFYNHGVTDEARGAHKGAYELVRNIRSLAPTRETS